MRRTVALMGTAALLLAVLFDPYTFRKTASDAVVAAAPWQTALGLVDALLLAVAGLHVWRTNVRMAFRVLCVEALFNLALSIAWILRDGLARFSRGFGGEEYLSAYLGLMMLRVTLLLVLSGSSSAVLSVPQRRD